jgi:hypothetical protein
VWVVVGMAGVLWVASASNGPGGVLAGQVCCAWSWAWPVSERIASVCWGVEWGPCVFGVGTGSCTRPVIVAGQTVYQLSEKFGHCDLVVWIVLLVIWLVTAKWRQPAVAQGEDPGCLQQLGRKRSRWMAVCLVAVAVLWPVLGFFFLLDFGCDLASC